MYKGAILNGVAPFLFEVIDAVLIYARFQKSSLTLLCHRALSKSANPTYSGPQQYPA